MSRARALAGMLLAGLSGAACDVPAPPGSTGGATLDGGACSSAIVVVESDYASTNVALLAKDGRVLTESLVSSATARLSKDVVLPSSGMNGDIVLIDRDLSLDAHLLWVDVAHPSVTRELSVSTGFPSDPRDYADIATGRAYVTRFNQNVGAGKVPFDVGSDVLVVDTNAPKIVGSIDLRPAMADAPSTLPRPDQIVVDGNRALVLLDALDAAFQATAFSRLVEIDTEHDTVARTLVLDGFRQCAGLVRSPFGQELAIFCLGKDSQSGSTLDGSGVVLVDITDAPAVTAGFRAADLGKNPVGFFGDYAAPHVLVVQTLGYGVPPDPVVQDALIRLDTSSGQHEVVLRSDSTPFTLGGVACEPTCGSCFVADAGRGGVVHRFDLDAEGRLSGDVPIVVERRIGLPPILLGKLR